MGDFPSGEGGSAIAECEVEPDGQRRMLLGQLHGFGGGGLVNHQARAGEYALGVCANDRLVDADTSPKIVRINYDRLHFPVDSPAGRSAPSGKISDERPQ